MRTPITLTHDRDRPAAPPAVRLLAALTEHRSLMLGVTAGVIAYAYVVGSPPPTVQLVILAAAVTIVGLPHGALDHLVGRQLFAPTLGRRWWVVFGLLYLGLAGTMASIWLAFPLAALVIFLGLSALHFGWDDPLWVRRSTGIWDAVEHTSVGALPIVLPTWLHAAEVTVIFGWMMPAAQPLDAEVVGAIAACAASIVLPVAGLRFVRLLLDRPAAPAAAAELAAIVVLHVVAPPLIAFLTYFCGWHSIRHALELADDLEPGRLRAGLRRFVREAAPMTLTTVAAALLVSAALTLTDVAVDSVLASVIFIGLSVLTVPHMAMMALARAADQASV
jgi:Brp/Blh family beta-carotene 15,15'-monooxygenase